MSGQDSMTLNPEVVCLKPPCDRAGSIRSKTKVNLRSNQFKSLEIGFIKSQSGNF